MSVGRICTRTVVTAAPGEPIIDVVRRMERNNVGAVVVVNEDARPVGIVTDRDVALRCVAGEHDPRDAVSVIMTREVRSVDESTPIE
ncbi:MAG: CBS domain-containing protein, partial [Gemmatimonadota bacterium]